MVDWDCVCGIAEDYGDEDFEIPANQMFGSGSSGNYSSYAHAMKGSSTDKVHNRCKQQKITCKYCGKIGLRWAEKDSGWRLSSSSGKLHTCKAYEDENEDLESEEE